MATKTYCTKCGSEVETKSSFCISCGEKVGQVTDETEIKNGTPIADSDSSSSFLQGLAGHATSSNVREAQETYGEMLVTGEQVLAAYKWVRDEVVLTSLRIIYMDVQGLTGKKKSFLSIPYESIHKFSKESAGWLDWDAELRIWVRGEEEPIKWEFRKDEAVNIIFSILSEKVLNKNKFT
jgi:hypothetical protein